MKLFSLLTPATCVLTPNRRLSAALSKLYSQHQIDSGKSCWQTLNILPISSWLQNLWQEFSLQQTDDMPMQISTNQEQLIWEEILRQSAEGESLLQLSSTAELVKSAWGTLKQWQVEIDNPALSTTEDGYIFQKWAHKFQERCHENNWLDTNSITANVIEAIHCGEIKLPAHIILYGFTEMSPQYLSLLEACRESGSEVISHSEDNSDNTISRICLNDEESEILSMARWARAILEKNPEAKIGCVFQRLEEIRDRVVRIFSAVFSEKNTFTLNPVKLPLNISAGKNLSIYPVIHTALELLNLGSHNISIEKISRILRSPFIGEAERECLPRAEFDNTLRRANVCQISLKKLSEKFNLENSCPALSQRFEDFLQDKISRKETRSISEWLEIFTQQLNVLGWPGERSLNSQEYQVVDSWFKLLIEYSAFNNVLGSITRRQALDYLAYLTSKKIFQPESPDAPIQILGMLEASELPLDYLWVMGLDDSAWPPAPKPNPFIPQKLQKTHKMPHANAERELIYCQQLTAQLKRGAPQVIFSYSRQSDDAELRPSPLITDLPEIKLEQISLFDFAAPAHEIYLSKNLETLNDETAPPILDNEKIRGGAKIFQLQAACPFRAFAEQRLHAERIEAPTPGLNAKDRGTVMHHALEVLWRNLQSQEQLLQLDGETLEDIVKNAVAHGISRVPIEAETNRRYLQLETDRLKKILDLWLEHEKTRRDFKVVAMEEEHHTSIGNIPIRLRIDRIDQLDNGKHVIIDYKTGKENSVREWFSERPDEPQLPLYCTINPEKTLGILFAKLNLEKMGYVGTSEVDLGIKSVKPFDKVKESHAANWQEQIQHWRTTLENLGQDFSNGKAQIDPKKSATCEHCHLQALCRIYESS